MLAGCSQETQELRKQVDPRTTHVHDERADVRWLAPGSGLGFQDTYAISRRNSFKAAGSAAGLNTTLDARQIRARSSRGPTQSGEPGEEVPE